eukprot:TRINITY_DN68086_c0_g1_i1.p1 TRINITY_DN68086_c0_g1~~TRINITY_DN68086_c0_g1_i1.p1  ORF type:complete len:598 (+),score=92.74 TRINITY_DN68086_c0_g1_i1:314-2107(+)
MQHVLATFREVDLNGDGCICLEEFCMLMGRLDSDIEPEASALFSVVDADGNGRISFEELLNFIYHGEGVEEGSEKSEVGAMLPRVPIPPGTKASDFLHDYILAEISCSSVRQEKFAELSARLSHHGMLRQGPGPPVKLPWDLDEGSAQRMEPTEGCEVELAEHRGITLAQLRPIWPYIQKNCASDEWRDYHGEVLEPHLVNLYTVCKYIIMPFTKVRQKSYMEHIASGAQLPTFFVSHWWGETVRNFMACLERHSVDRGIGEDAPYWVCAYSNNQWELDGSVTKDPADSAFRRAMRLSEGLVSIIDANCVVFTRIWCCYELAVTMAETDQEGYMYDLVTACSCKDDEGEWYSATCISTSGFMASDGGHARVKTAREMSFPCPLLAKAMRVRLQDGQATMNEDRVHILNAIRNADDLDELPLAEDERYDELNALLCGRISLGTLRIAVDSGMEVECFAAIAKSQLTVFFADFSGCDAFTPEMAERLFEALPDTLQKFTLSGSRLEAFSDKLCKLTRLHSVSLRCNPVLASVPEWVLQLQHLRYFSVAECTRITCLPAGFEQKTRERPIVFDLCNCPLAEDSWKPSWFPGQPCGCVGPA